MTSDFTKCMAGCRRKMPPLAGADCGWCSASSTQVPKKRNSISSKNDISFSAFMATRQLSKLQD
ncbi:hypothetical protein BEN48_03190 [Hymenobacter glacialis]|uniref:Uncharacterized protein n=1 Tax=Hymenobacter glacialis TaxID=1908236 RepID=A0A1G1SYT5_9BACT|nr:hypothetical protein BEN48_03190 [Hymenobacter glacialis]